MFKTLTVRVTWGALGVLFSTMVSAQALVIIDRAGLTLAPNASAAPAPDFDGDGVPDRFELVRDPRPAATAVAATGRDRVCLRVAISAGPARWTHEQAFCDKWAIMTIAAPNRGYIQGRQPWVARIAPSLDIPGVGSLPTARDAVLLKIDGVPSVLFFDGSRYTVHQQLNFDRLIFLEGVEALRRFELG